MICISILLCLVWQRLDALKTLFKMFFYQLLKAPKSNIYCLLPIAGFDEFEGRPINEHHGAGQDEGILFHGRVVGQLA